MAETGQIRELFGMRSIRNRSNKWRGMTIEWSTWFSHTALQFQRKQSSDLSIAQYTPQLIQFQSMIVTMRPRPKRIGFYGEVETVYLKISDKQIPNVGRSVAWGWPSS
jgi:hypothetical protein